MLQRPHRVLSRIGEQWKGLDNQHDLAGEPEKRFEDVQSAYGWHQHSRHQILSPGCHGGSDDAREDDPVDEGCLPGPQVEYSSDISRDQIFPGADETGEQVSDSPFNARLQSSRGMRRTKPMSDLEVRDLSTQLTLAFRRC